MSAVSIVATSGASTVPAPSSMPTSHGVRVFLDALGDLISRFRPVEQLFAPAQVGIAAPAVTVWNCLTRRVESAHFRIPGKSFLGIRQ
jgi:hypothetical protein